MKSLLKTVWYVDAWKNADGSIYSLEVGAVVAQDWWSIAGKDRLTYSAALLDGSTTIETYSGVSHPYGSQWLTCIQAATPQVGRRHWFGGAIPTLTYQRDAAAVCATLLHPPLDTSLSPTSVSATPLTYVPCQSGPTPTDENKYHRTNIDGEGGYSGRGPITLVDAVALVRNTALDAAHARVNAHSGLSVPYHYRSNRTRTRPGDSRADVANTIIAQPLMPTHSGDFTAQGMPAPVEAFADGRSSSSNMDGYVGPAGGMGVWVTQTGDASHAVPYSYGHYLYEGERYHLEAQLDHATYALHQQIDNYGTPALLLANDSAYASLNIPTGRYNSIPQLWKPSNVRAAGWAMNLLGKCAVTPATHPARGWVTAWVNQVGAWVENSMQYQPPDMAAAGAFFCSAKFDGLPSTGMRFALDGRLHRDRRIRRG